MDTDRSLRLADYEETHAALNLAFVTRFLAAPTAAAVLSVVLGVLVNSTFYSAIGGVIVAFLVCGSLVRRCWPTGIRIDESGITIGAIRSPRAATRKPDVYSQAWGIYTCPWEAVRSARVTTDPAELRHFAKSADYYTLTNRWGGKFDMTYCNIGVLSSPSMRAALVAEIDPDMVTGTALQPGIGYEGYKRGKRDRVVPPRMSATWIVPTRFPEALREALKRYSSGSL